MSFFTIKPVSHLKGEILLPGDKSIAHRVIMLASLAKGKTRVKNFPFSEDCLTTLKVFRNLGIRIDVEKGLKKESSTITIWGRGIFGLKPKTNHIFVGNSGTTLRLILGILAGQNFKVTLEAGSSLSRRPMLRVTKPLRMMGAQIFAIRNPQSAIPEEYPPITIQGAKLKGITYKIPVASAQVKSALLLAGLYALNRTHIIEPIKTRDHTERLLKLFKAKIKVKGKDIFIWAGKELTSPGEIYIPADISSAAFFIVAATILPEAEIVIKKVSLNPTRLGLVKVLKRMGAKIEIKYEKSKMRNYEPIGEIKVRNSHLRGTRVRKEEIPLLIDELPILMVAACFASGQTILEGIQELRVKETDRINSMVENLRRMQAEIKVIKQKNLEKIIIEGKGNLKGARLSSYGDHRTAMSMVIAGLRAKGNTYLDDILCINKSFPQFLLILKRLKA